MERPTSSGETSKTDPLTLGPLPPHDQIPSVLEEDPLYPWDVSLEKELAEPLLLPSNGQPPLGAK